MMARTLLRHFQTYILGKIPVELVEVSTERSHAVATEAPTAPTVSTAPAVSAAPAISTPAAAIVIATAVVSSAVPVERHVCF